MLSGKVAMITGGARGIGKVTALTLAKDGADIAILDANEEEMQKTSEEIIALGKKCITIKADVTSLSEIEGAIKNILDSFGKIDILVNNAGITRDNLILRMKEEDWDAVINVNLKGVFICTKAILRTMMKQRSGSIVNVSSVVGVMGNSGQANYSAAKAGIIGLTKTTAKEVASRGVTVNAIAPGFIDTEMTKKLPDDIKEELTKHIPLGRFGQPQDVANLISFLVSSKADYITGEIIRVDGGMIM